MATPQISRNDLQLVKKAIDDAEAGRATLPQLALAHSVCERAGATKTLGIIRSHIHRYTPGPSRFSILPNIIAGLISGTIVWFFLGRRAAA